MSTSPKRLLSTKDITRLLQPMFVRDMGNYVGGGHWQTDGDARGGRGFDPGNLVRWR